MDTSHEREHKGSSVDFIMDLSGNSVGYVTKVHWMQKVKKIQCVVP